MRKSFGAGLILSAAVVCGCGDPSSKPGSISVPRGEATGTPAAESGSDAATTPPVGGEAVKRTGRRMD